jgi:hypothetical protein
MKAIIFNNYINQVNGALIDCIEYYLCILEQTNDINLLILNYNKEFKKILIDLIKDRYELDGLDFESNIVGITKSDLIRIKFDKLLITDYGTIVKTRGLILTKDFNSKILILSDLHTDKPEFTIDKSLYPKGSVIYYGEMPFVYKDIQYRHKFLFSRFKKIDKDENTVLIHSPKNNDYSFMKDYEILFETKKIIYKTDIHKKHLFELFDTFLYYHADKWFDPRPRLMHECYFYGKYVMYSNKSNCKDGSFYRALDLSERKLDDRYLTKDDEIVRQFI